MSTRTLPRPAARPQYRISQWLNTKTLKPVYGIQAKTSAGWLNCSANGRPLFYNDEALALRHLAWLRDPKGMEPEWSDDSNGQALIEKEVRP